MIQTIFMVQWLQLRRDVVALIMTFVLPIVFFTVYALMLGRVEGAPKEEKIKVLVADQDSSEFSRAFVGELSRQPALDVVATSDDISQIEQQIVSDRIPVALLIPSGLGQAWSAMAPRDRTISIIYDPANPYARFVVAGHLQSLALTFLPRLIESHAADLTAGVGMTAEMQRFVTDINGVLCFEKQCDHLLATNGILEIATTPLKGSGDGNIAYYAAGVGVMFLLFSMAGAGGSLLAEEESGTLERLMGSRLSMGQYIIGCWMFFACIGALQLIVMFVWAGSVFSLPQVNLSFAVCMLLMIVATAMAAAAFGMVLAALCRTRAQLSGVSTTVILIMSALGGSMFPRFLMPEILEKIGFFTFNGWAIDGFTRIFGQANSSAVLGAQILVLLPNLSVLLIMTIAFLVLSRRMAVRWEVS